MSILDANLVKMVMDICRWCPKGVKGKREGRVRGGSDQFLQPDSTLVRNFKVVGEC